MTQQRKASGSTTPSAPSALALGIIETIVADDQERGGKRYLERITPSFAVQTQQKLNNQLKKIQQARKSLE
jgi:hypothetical protein